MNLLLIHNFYHYILNVFMLIVGCPILLRVHVFLCDYLNTYVGTTFVKPLQEKRYVVCALNHNSKVEN